MEGLPVELTCKILEMLPTSSIYRCKRLNKSFLQLIEHYVKIAKKPLLKVEIDSTVASFAYKLVRPAETLFVSFDVKTGSVSISNGDGIISETAKLIKASAQKQSAIPEIDYALQYVFKIFDIKIFVDSVVDERRVKPLLKKLVEALWISNARCYETAISDPRHISCLSSLRDQELRQREPMKLLIKPFDIDLEAYFPLFHPTGFTDILCEIEEHWNWRHFSGLNCQVRVVPNSGVYRWESNNSDMAREIGDMDLQLIDITRNQLRYLELDAIERFPFEFGFRSTSFQEELRYKLDKCDSNYTVTALVSNI